MSNIGEITAQLGCDIRELERSIKRAEKDIKGYERTTARQLDKTDSRWARSSKKIRGSLNSVESGIFSLKSALGVAVLGAAVGYSVKRFADFEKGLIGVAKTTNFTETQMKGFKKEIVDMSGDIPVTTLRLLEIGEAAGQLGAKGVDNVALFTETMAKMEIASDVVGSEGAKSLARLLNTAGEGTDKIDKLGSVIVELGNNMAASEKEIVHMAGEIGRATAAYSVASEHSVALGAALKAMGARAELSGSAISKTMIMMDKAIAGGGEKLEALAKTAGMTSKQFTKTFKTDAAKAFTAFIGGLNKATRGTKSAVTMLEEFGLSGLESVKGLSPLIENVEELERAMAMVNIEVENATALDKEAEAASKGFSAQMQISANMLNNIASAIGEGLAPVLLDINEDFQMFVKANDEFFRKDLPEMIVSSTKDLGNAFGVVLDVVAGFKRTFQVAGRAVAVVFLGMEKLVLEFANSILNEPIDAINFFIEKWNSIPATKKIDIVPKTDMGLKIQNELEIVDGAISMGLQDIANILKEPLPSQVFDQLIQNAKNAQKEIVKTNTAAGKEGGDGVPGGAPEQGGYVAGIDMFSAQGDTQTKEQGLAEQEKNLASLREGVNGLYSDINDRPWWADFQKGASDAFETIQDNSMTTSEIVSTTMVSVFDGVGQAFADWATGAKSFKDAFKDMARSVIKDLINMITKQLLFNAISSIVGGIGGGGGGGAGVASSAAGYGGAKQGAVFNQSGGTFATTNSFAQGGAFTNSIVSSPTRFTFANGSEFGEMGEAGPEAVMPLGKTGKGDLGVKVSDSMLNTAAEKPEVNNKIINVFDPEIVGDYMQTSEGEQQVVNIMQKNKDVVQQ